MASGNTNNEGLAAIVGAVLGFVVGMLILSLVGASQCSQIESEFKSQAIEHGFAEYDTKTGVWKWKESVNAESAKAE
jgi:uncharacterized membrane-anchored protein YhcB (DUF1043 family)